MPTQRTTEAHTIEVHDPCTGRLIGSVPACGKLEADVAVAQAQLSFPDWARTPASERAAALKTWARRLRDHAGELAELQSRENGKPLEDSAAGVEAGIAAIEQYAELGPLHRARSLQGRWGATDFMAYEPYGVAAVLVPWNDPVAIAAQNIAAAIVAGNVVVFKPSEKTPLTGLRLVDLAGKLTPGVIVTITGDERAGRALVAHADVDVVVHTGAVSTGLEIAAACASRLAKCVLELGGNDPLIVDDDLDPRWAAEQAASGAFAYAGQICVSVERIYVHRALAAPFIEALVDVARATTLPPLIDAAQREKVDEQVQAALAAGARALTGGRIPAGPGWFYPPTVLVDVDDDMDVMTQETFGPVAPVRVVGSFDEALERANASDYGLAATVLTGNEAHVQRAWRELQAGTVKVNDVWGGAPGGAASPRKLSGTGLGYGPELLDELTQLKVVHVEPPVVERGSGRGSDQ
jgi:acyl-CoA reductase-like NAD-dependent aldehyde dehydrogenase